MFRNVSTLGEAGIPGVISSAPTEITLSAVRLRRRRRLLQEKFLDLILISLLISHQQSFKHVFEKEEMVQENLFDLYLLFLSHYHQKSFKSLHIVTLNSD